MKKLGRTLDAAALYSQLGRLIESMPNLNVIKANGTAGNLPPETMQWLGRAQALVTEALGIAGEVEWKSAFSMRSQYPSHTAQELARLLYLALGHVEVELPAAASGAFIPAGNSFDALKALQRIFSNTKTEVLVVDPYMDQNFLTEFAIFIPENCHIRLLADSGSLKPTLAPALRQWVTQYGRTRPIEARLAPARSLHDRLIAIDSQRVWTVGQSFKDLAARAPTSFIESDAETAALKVAAYNSIWSTSTAVS